MKKNVASQSIGAQMVSATDGSAFTGAVTVHITGDGGTQATGTVGSGACTHEGNGYHSYAPSQAETNFDHIAFTFTGTGAIPATVQVYTDFPQTGDSFARLGAPAGASVSADIAAIEAQTDDIGAAGAGLTAVPWNAAWDTEVQSEVADALAAYDGPTNAEMEARTLLAASYATAATQTTIAGYIDTEVASVLAAVDTEVAAIKAKTDSLTFTTAGQVDATTVTTAAGAITSASIATGAIDADALATDAITEIADGVLDRNMATGTDSGTATVRTARQALRALRNKVSIAAGTATICKEDDTTSSWTAAVTTTAGDPISAVDPASA